ncbi:MAG: hypothetical protein FWF80_09060 [Defluviitaleaceae bacterium]|nr:hypothetical protein [Defluviitaleaceae bacterium]
MVALGKCELGHLYNASIYFTCPYCSDFFIDRDEVKEPEKNKPVVGWLVCVMAKNEAYKALVGQDYRVVSGENKIGRESYSNQIVIVGDAKVAPTNHATLDYRKGEEMVGDTRIWLNPNRECGTCYFDGKPLNTSVPLENTKVSPYIEIGNGVYVYVPFEGNQPGLKFNWNDLDAATEDELIPEE